MKKENRRHRFMYAMEHINLCTNNHSPSRTTCEGHCIKNDFARENRVYLRIYQFFSACHSPFGEYLKSSWLTGRREFVIMLPRALYILPEYFPLLLGTGNYFYKLGQGFGTGRQGKRS